MRQDEITADVAANLAAIKERIAAAAKEALRPGVLARLIAVSKTFEAAHIVPALEAGHRVFGENRVQEAARKWPALRPLYPDIELHLIGPLQSNKAAEAVSLFDVIQSVDRDKIAVALAREIKAQGRQLKCLVQVNTGEEPQKAGVPPRETLSFVARCRDEYGLEIHGLMCIPPVDDNPAPHFALLDELADRAGLAFRSMGMSKDFEAAIHHGATHVRIGSAIFGHRD